MFIIDVRILEREGRKEERINKYYCVEACESANKNKFRPAVSLCVAHTKPSPSLSPTSTPSSPWATAQDRVPARAGEMQGSEMQVPAPFCKGVSPLVRVSADTWAEASITEPRPFPPRLAATFKDALHQDKWVGLGCGFLRGPTNSRPHARA